jgi:hypothetical protein
MQTLVKTYRGSQRGATDAFKQDAQQMAAKGMLPTSQTWAPGSYGLGAFLFALLLCVVLIGFVAILYMLVVKPSGTLTVTYSAKEAAPAAATEKVCPKCAESVKSLATVCRFCGHTFPEPEPLPAAQTTLARPTPRPQSMSYEFGVWFGSMWPHRWFKIATFAVPFLIVAELMTSRALQVNEASATGASVGAPSSASSSSQVTTANAERDKCTLERAGQLTSYQSLLKSGKAAEAAGAIRACSKALNDVEMKKLLADAEIQSYKQTIGSTNASKAEKLRAMQSLVRDYPAAGKQYEPKIAPLGLQIAKEQAAADAARHRKEGVHIGMSETEVLQSKWGRPESVNRTITADGRHEQWVYSGGYLYFDDGVLTSIQN